jgi:RHS repeat-associated protein
LSRYYYDEQMGFEEDRTHFAGSFGPNIDCDVTANALGARGIDRIQKYVRSSTNWGVSWTRSNPSQDVLVYPLYDAHGNMVRTLSRTSSGGYAVSAVTVVDPWGTKLSSGTGEKRDYCASIGHVTDDESGLVYMRARYYEPGTGRFVSEDPAMDGLDWYVYCNDSPTMHLDESGMSPKWLRVLTSTFSLLTSTVGFALIIGGAFALAASITPADRLLACQTLVQGIKIVSLAFAGYGGGDYAELLSIAEAIFQLTIERFAQRMASAAQIGGKTFAFQAIVGSILYATIIFVFLLQDATEAAKP